MTFAQFIGSGSTGIVGAINTILVPLLMTFAFLVFIWGVIKFFFLEADNPTEREKGRSFALWGILGLVVILSVWSLVWMLLSTLNLSSGR